MTRIAVNGAAGRMGRSVISVVLADPQAELAAAIEHAGHAGLAAAIEHAGHAGLGSDAALLAGRADVGGIAIDADVDRALDRAQVVIDFSKPDATRELLLRCAAHRVPAVVGTTGMDAASKDALAALARVAPAVYAPNFSVGVNVLWALCARAVQLCGEDFDLELIEMHHHHKVDSPSGTAVKLLDVVAQARGVAAAEAAVHGRNGLVGARRHGEIGVHALRGGDVVGDHTLVLAGPGERLEITHRAHSREIFARGAVRAAHWVVGKAPGLYEMSDVLGLRA